MKKGRRGAGEADETVAAHVALRQALIPDPTSWIHRSEGLLASTAEIACATCNTIYVHGRAAKEAELARLLAILDARPFPYQLTVRSSLFKHFAPIAEAAGLSHTTDLPMMTVKPVEFRPAACPTDLELRVLPSDAEPFHLDLVAWGLGMSREGLAHLMSRANLATPAWTTYIGEVDGELAVTGTAIAGPSGAGLIAIVTDPRFGRRGFAAALTSAAVADAFARGLPRVFLHSSPQGYAVYERLGFQTVEQLSIFGRADRTK